MNNAKSWISSAFNLPLLSQKRYNWVDYLRGIIIILVVYHHTYLGLESSGFKISTSLYDANMVFYSFRMPLFFIISGIFTSRSLFSKPVKDLIWIKYDKIFYPYLVWSFLQITLQIIFSKFSNSEKSLHDYLYILYQPRRIEQFWYLPALFNATLVFIFFKAKVKLKTSLHFLLGLALYFIAPFVSSISMISDWMSFYIFVVIGDLAAGFIFKKRVQKYIRKPITFLLMLPVFLLVQLHYLHNNTSYLHNGLGKKATEMAAARPHTNFLLYMFNESNFLLIALVGCSMLIIFSFLLEKWNRLSFLRIVGYHSLYIYITQIIIVAFIRLLFIHVFHIYNIAVILIAAVFFGVILPIIFYNLFGKRSLWFLFSSRKERKDYYNQPKEEAIKTLPAEPGSVKTATSNT